MSTLKPFIVTVAGCLFTVVFTILAIYSTYNRHSLSLPTPVLAHVLGLAIPLLNALAAYGAFRGAFQRGLPFAIPSPLALLAILDTILLTLTAADLRPQVRTCLLETHWRTLFKAKDSASVRRIQDALDCCGFHSTRDQAWPFPRGSHGADACVLRTARENHCEPGLSQRQTSVLSMLLAIAAVAFVGKALVWLLARENSSWLQTQNATLGRTSSHMITNAEEPPNTHGRYIDNPQGNQFEEQDAVDERHPGQLI